MICADINSAFKDIKNKKGQKSRPETLRRHRETIEATTRPPNTPPINVKDRVAEWTNAIEAQSEQLNVFEWDCVMLLFFLSLKSQWLM